MEKSSVKFKNGKQFTVTKQDTEAFVELIKENAEIQKVKHLATGRVFDAINAEDWPTVNGVKRQGSEFYEVAEISTPRMRPYSGVDLEILD